MSIPQTPSPLSNIIAAKTYNAAWFSGSTKETQISAAIAAAKTDGALYVYIPANMFPYNANVVTFDNSIHMLREGSNPGEVDVNAYGAAGDNSQDDTVAIQKALLRAAAIALAGSGGSIVNFPTGIFKVTSSLAISSSSTLRGQGVGSSIIKFYGCDGLSLNTDDIQIKDMQLWSLDSNGTSDPETNDGLICNGTSGTHVNNIQVQNVFLRGWATAVNAKYTWSSRFSFVYTILSSIGFKSLGLTGNNAISDSFLNGTNRGLSCEQDSGNHGEGLNITGTFISGSNYGVWADQFIKLGIVGCTIDLCGIGVSLTNCAGELVGCWVYASTGDAIRFEDLGAYTQNAFKVTGCDLIRSTTARSVYIGVKNQHVGIINCTLQYSTAAIFIDATALFCTTFPNTTINGAGVTSEMNGGISQTDADADLTIPDGGFQYDTYYFNVGLATVARNCNLPTRASSWNGRRIRVRRVGGGAVAGDLNVKEAAADGGAVLKVLPNSVAAYGEFEFAGLLGTPAWILVGYGLL